MGLVVVGFALMLVPPVGMSVLLVGLYQVICRKYIDNVKRIFLEKPLFIIPRGQPDPSAEDITLKTSDDLNLRACYFKHTAAERRGVILFGLEFGSNRWAAGPCVDYLQASGFDIFTYEPRNQGESDHQPDFEPLQWVTDREVGDCRTAIEYLKSRPDADPNGIGLYGFSKGANAGLIVAADDPFIRCAVTDGAFGHHTVMVPYMRVWFSIYDAQRPMHGLVGAWFFGLVARRAVQALEHERGDRFPNVEFAVKKLSPRPLLMIHGAADTYIKPVMAQALFSHAGQPKEIWIVEGAKHNQALQTSGDEYRQKVTEFFQKHLKRC